ncbi:unnamed protein product [Symbiodinium natans]|uniref:Uncharacterized protein n=1 Tax=Symbiodinium natans TaxID=878477 RepID=A0A812UG09_9DINO|nr:unnamed protein product [Symbiodinium natans]
MSDAFDSSLVRLSSSSRMERDEGDMDCIVTSTLTYDGTTIWTYTSANGSNIGGAWGTDHSASLSPDKATVTIKTTNVSGNVSTGRKEAPGGTEQVDVRQVWQAWKEKQNK